MIVAHSRHKKNRWKTRKLNEKLGQAKAQGFIYVFLSQAIRCMHALRSQPATDLGAKRPVGRGFGGGTERHFMFSFIMVAI